MDLVRYYAHVEFLAELAYPRKCILIPDIARRVLVITEDHEGSLGISKLCYKIVPVDTVFVLVLVIDELVLHYSPAVIEDGVEEYGIYGSLDKYVLPRGSELSYRGRYGGYHTRHEYEPVLLYLEVMPCLPPVDISIVPFFGIFAVAVDAV